MTDLPDQRGRESSASESAGDVLIAYESDQGRASRAAAAMALAVRDLGQEPVVRMIDEVTPADIINAKTLLVGGWVRTRYPFGGATIDHALHWIEGLPPLDGKLVGVFCTYRFFPRTFADTTARVSEALGLVKRGFEAKGAVVVADHSLHMRKIEEGSQTFVHSVLTWPIAS
ncbi:hypothetical protein ACFLRH_02565 [Actinomycetota bacterium]